jgi:N-acetyl-gamma-glutamylphosphate reductase
MKTQGEPRARRVAVAGASGYTGVELLRFLVQHPAARVVALTAETHANQAISQVFPNLKGFVDLTCLDRLRWRARRSSSSWRCRTRRP